MTSVLHHLKGVKGVEALSEKYKEGAAVVLVCLSSGAVFCSRLFFADIQCVTSNRSGDTCSINKAPSFSLQFTFYLMWEATPIVSICLQAEQMTLQTQTHIHTNTQ